MLAGPAVVRTYKDNGCVVEFKSNCKAFAPEVPNFKFHSNLLAASAQAKHLPSELLPNP